MNETVHKTRLVGTMICFVGLAVGLSGCNKKPVVAPLPPVLTPVALDCAAQRCCSQLQLPVALVAVDDSCPRPCLFLGRACG